MCLGCGAKTCLMWCVDCRTSIRVARAIVASIKSSLKTQNVRLATR